MTFEAPRGDFQQVLERAREDVGALLASTKYKTDFGWCGRCQQAESQALALLFRK